MDGLLRRAWMGFQAGLLVGIVVTGIGGRLTMRLIALGQDRAPMFSLGGSVTVVAVGTVFAGGAGVLYGLVRKRLPGPGWVRGLAFSVILQVLLLLRGFPLPLVPPRGRIVRGDVVPRVAFPILFLLAGLVLEWAHAWLRRRRAGATPSATTAFAGQAPCA